MTLSFFVDRTIFAFLETNLVWLGLSYSFLSPFSGRCPYMTEILLTWTLGINTINQLLKINLFLKLKLIKYSYMYLSILAVVLGFLNLS